MDDEWKLPQLNKIQVVALVGGIGIVGVGLLVYFMAIRPAMVRSHCNSLAVSTTKAKYGGNIVQSVYQTYYDQCLETHGQAPPQVVGQPIPVE